MATNPPSAADRIVMLDIVRGVAVMGILAMNITAFAMPFQAYMNPNAYGTESVADLAGWVFNFVLIDGKMRGLFSFLFGASMLLVIERAVAARRSPARIHFVRMAWLLVFGLIHFYFIWFGDILTSYALVGMVAYAFHRFSAKALVRWAIGLLVLQFLVFAGIAVMISVLAGAAAEPGAPADIVATWKDMERQFAVPGAQALAAKLSMFLGDYGPIAAYRLADWFEPLGSTLLFGAETLAYFLIGMALLKTGFLRGEWAPERYRRVVLIGYGIGIPGYAAMAWLLVRDDFGIPAIFAAGIAGTTPFRPPMILATAALVILLTRHGGAVIERIAAAGRAAFTNYLGTSIVMTTLFYGYGLGLYGSLSRIELWLPVLAMWALMLLWSKPWLDRFRYGPLEWLWRSLARGRVEPLRRAG